MNEQFRKSALTIGFRMAVLSGAMVLAGAALFSAALWWKVTHGPEEPESLPSVTITLDVVDMVAAFALVGFVAVIVAGVAAFFFTRQATRPLQEAMQRQRTFIADASHELRTPLSTMHMRVQQLQMLGGDEKMAPVIDELRRDTTGMVEIVNDLLAIASAEGNDAAAPLADVLDRLTAELSAQADALDVQLRTEPVEAWVNLSDVALKRCLTALVTNALSHTPAGGTVTVTCAKERGMVVARVADTGGGITGIAPERIFDRFAHGAPGRLGSHGIGLALVRDTVEHAGGRVEVEETGSKGSVVKLELHEAASPRG